ncbi:MAG: hypothetical protein EA424_21660 [Planctomycetaceae bacterium]|nr:MAG: hypothetical protein EA424_21660 [Planctomycetaceae bacterium]
MPLFLRFLLLSVDLVFSLTPDFMFDWVIAMKQNRTILTFAAFFLMGQFLAASSLCAMDGLGRRAGFSGHVSAPNVGSFQSFIQDENPPAAPGRTSGFEGYLGHAESDGPWPSTPRMDESYPATCSSGGCYGFSSQHGYTRMWASVDYMMLWSKGRELPPLASTDITQAGGFPATILFGGESIGEDLRSAGRFSLGFWLDPCERVGVGGRFLLSETDQTSFNMASNANGLPVLARPFFDTGLPPQGPLDAVIISSPGQPANVGSISDRATNDLMNLDAYLRVLLYEFDNRRLDLLVGYQYSEIRDRLRLTSASGPGSIPRPFTMFDAFDAKNTFHGGVVGLQGEYNLGRLSLSMLSKLGVGNMNQRVQIGGNSSVDQPPFTCPGGMLAQPVDANGGNMGTYRDDVLSIVPEVEVKLLYEVTRGLELSLGYSFVYWTDVALAGDQIDTTTYNGYDWPQVDRNQFFGGSGNSPNFTGIHDAGFWAQGLTFGVTLKR